MDRLFKDKGFLAASRQSSPEQAKGFRKFSQTRALNSPCAPLLCYGAVQNGPFPFVNANVVNDSPERKVNAIAVQKIPETSDPRIEVGYSGNIWKLITKR